MEAKKNDLVVVTIRGRHKVARYVGPAPAGGAHIVSLGDRPVGDDSDCKLLPEAAILTLDVQPGTV